MFDTRQPHRAPAERADRFAEPLQLFTLAGGIGLGYELNQEHRCIVNRGAPREPSCDDAAAPTKTSCRSARAATAAQVADLNGSLHPFYIVGTLLARRGVRLVQNSLSWLRGRSNVLGRRIALALVFMPRRLTCSANSSSDRVPARALTAHAVRRSGCRRAARRARRCTACSILSALPRQRFAHARQEHRLHLGRQAQQGVERTLRAGFLRAREQLGDVAVVQARDDRRDRDAGFDAGRRQRRERLEAPVDRRGARFDRAPGRVVRERMLTNTSTRARCWSSSSTSRSRTISALFVMIATGFLYSAHIVEQRARESIAPLERLIAIGVAGERDRFALQLLLLERLAQQLGRVDLDDDLALEVGAGAEAPVLMARARVAVRARVLTAAVRVHAEAEAEVGAVVLRDDASWAALRARGATRAAPRRRPRRPRSTRNGSWGCRPLRTTGALALKFVQL